MRHIIHFLKPYRLAAAAALALMLVELVVELWHPLLMAKVINEGIMSKDKDAILLWGAVMAVVALFGFISGIVNSYLAAHVSQGFGFDIRNALFEKVQALTFAAFNRYPAATLLTRMTGDVTQLQNVVFMGLRIMMRAPLLMIGGLVMALTINVKLAMVLVILTPLLFGMLVWMMRRGFALFQAVQERLDRTNGLLRENLLGMRLIKALVRGRHERERFERANEDLMTRTISAIRLIELTVPALLMVMNLSILFLLWFGSVEVTAGRANVGEIVAVVNYATRIIGAFSVISWIVTGLSRAKASAVRVSEVLEESSTGEAARAGVLGEPAEGAETAVSSESSASAESAHAANFGAAISFEHVSFRYPDSPDKVLIDLTVSIRPGQTAAILGATGSGKSSLFQLIPRLYDPEEGIIRIDGQDIRGMDPVRLRSQIGYVPQETVLFSGTVRSNLLWGKEDAPDSSIVIAAQNAQIHETIMRLPEQYETVLGQKGVNLSGGQKQRLSVARALLRSPRLLLLDDSTSALDTMTEAAMLRALKQYGATTLIITQKIATAMEADTVLLLEEGRLHDQGTHAELLARSLLYRRIVQSQFGEEAVRRG
jgi:ATP-binding cassette, subfamily B, multidrug efflux pump